MSQRDDVNSLVGLKVLLGPSQIFGVTVVPGLNSTTVKYFSGGSLEIGGASLTWGAGYLLGTNEIVNIPSNGNFYLAVTGATVTCYILKGRSNGFE